MAPPTQHGGTPARTSAVIVGTDALLAARPASPIQVAHACLALGYDLVVPVSWGDELIAAECTRQLAGREGSPAIFCNCANVAAKVLSPGPDLTRFLMAFAPPPVAAARYLRALAGEAPVRLTYLGACPGANDPAIDARVTPVEFLGILFERGMLLAEQPKVFDSVLPPDRRRWWSLPGGLPNNAALWRQGIPYAVTELDGDDVGAELAQRLIAQDRELIDLAACVGCVCCGARPDVLPARARDMVLAFEPPRAPSPVLNDRLIVDLSAPAWPEPLPAIGAPSWPSSAEVPIRPIRLAGEGARLARVEQRVSPVSMPAITAEYLASAARRRRGLLRRLGTRRRAQVPQAALPDGRVLPRAYVARRVRDGRSGASKPWASLPSLPSKSWVVL